MLTSIFEKDENNNYGPLVQVVPASEMKWPGENLNYPSEIIYDHKLLAGARFLWLRLVEYTDSNDEIMISTRELAKIANCSASTITRFIKNLEDQKYLQVIRKHKSHSSYKLLLEGEAIDWPNGYKGVAPR